MAYRIHRNGFVIEADTVEDVQALIAAVEKPLLPMMAERRTEPRAQKKAAQRGASDGSLEGRIVTALEKGGLRPGELAEQVQAERYNVGLALKALQARGTVRIDGTTMNRRVTLAKAKPKEAVQ